MLNNEIKPFSTLMLVSDGDTDEEYEEEVDIEDDDVESAVEWLLFIYIPKMQIKQPLKELVLMWKMCSVKCAQKFAP